MHGLSKHSHKCLRQTNVSPFCLLVRLCLAKILRKKNLFKKRIIISLLCNSLAHAEEGSREDTSVES